MSDLNQKLDRFTSAILAEATADSERNLAELSTKRTAAYSSAEEQVLGEAYRYIHSEVERIKTEAGRRVSRHMLDDKRTLYLRRETMADEVFGAVREKLAAYTAGSDYPKRLAAIYADALATLSGATAVRVYLRSTDLALSSTLAAISPNVKAEFVAAPISLGGLIAEAPALGKRVDATFDAYMEELSGHFAELFGLSLAGELEEEVQA